MNKKQKQMLKQSVKEYKKSWKLGWKLSMAARSSDDSGKSVNEQSVANVPGTTPDRRNAGNGSIYVDYLRNRPRRVFPPKTWKIHNGSDESIRS